MKPEEKVVELLKKHQLKLTTIESCTAGAIAARIVDVPGASEVFEQGFVTYSNEAKMRAVKVREEVFENTVQSARNVPKKWFMEDFWRQKQI